MRLTQTRTTLDPRASSHVGNTRVDCTFLYLRNGTTWFRHRYPNTTGISTYTLTHVSRYYPSSYSA